MIWTEQHSPALQDVISRCRATLDEHVLNANFLISRDGDSFLLYSKGPLTQVFARMVEILVEDLPECEAPARAEILRSQEGPPPRANRDEMKLGIAPIGWANDDIRTWGSDRTASEIMAEVARAGYHGSEMSYTYPQEPAALKAALAEHGLELSGAYRWTNLASPSEHNEELARTFAHVDFCARAGAHYAILAEGWGSLHWSLTGQSEGITPLGEAAWLRLADGIRRVAAQAASQGVRLCYHAHAGTAIERRREIDKLFGLLKPEELSFCLDTAQLAYAGEDPEEAARDYAHRIPYAHLKDVRPAVLDKVHLKRPKFLEAVRQNVFCTPGQGGLDFAAILPHLRMAEWWVVEADQDPWQAPPFEVAQAARVFVEGLA